MDEPAIEQWRTLAWRAWSTLGVSGWTAGDVTTVIDPEALIAMSAFVADERLWLESIDWGSAHAPLLMPSRLRRIAREASTGERCEQWIATVALHADGVRWTSRSAPLEEYERSRKSRRFDGSRGATAGTAALRLRAVAGATARTELLRALHPTARGHERDVTRTELIERAAVARGQIHVALDELVDAGIVQRNGTPRRQRIAPRAEDSDALAHGFWQPWRELPFGPWRDAARIGASCAFVDVDPPADRAHTWMVAAAARWDDERPSIARVMPEVSLARRAGSLSEVHDQIRTQSRIVSRSMIVALAPSTSARA